MVSANTKYHLSMRVIRKLYREPSALLQTIESVGRHSGRAPLRRESRNPVNTGLLVRVIRPARTLGLSRVAAGLRAKTTRGDCWIPALPPLSRGSAGMTTPGDLHKASKTEQLL